MSWRGEGDISKSTENDSDCSCSKVTFNIFNSLLWVFSIALLALGAWQAAASPSFPTGYTAFLYGILAVAVVCFVMCVTGFLASLIDHINMTGAYLILFVLLFLTELSLLLVCYATYPTETDVLKQVWNETGDYMKELTSSNLGCCGFNTWSDTYKAVADVPLGCIDTNDGSIYDNGCKETILNYFTAYGAFFIIVLLIPALIEVMAFLAGVLYLRLLLKKAQEARSYPRNTIVPLMTEDMGTHAHPVKSAASGTDVRIDVNSRPNAQGNTALFRVAGVMLDE